MRLAALAPLAVAVAVVVGCGADKTPVAHVAGATITRGQLNDLAASPGPPKPTARERQAALGTLIHFQWVRAEAKAEGVTLTDAEHKKIRSEVAGKASERELQDFGLDEKL